MLRRSWLFAVPLLASLLWWGAGPSQSATTPAWTIDGINNLACSDAAINLPVTFTNASDLGYTAHTTLDSDGKRYMNEGFIYTGGDGPNSWNFASVNSYDGQPLSGTWPLTSGKQLRFTIALEKPKGTVRTSWTMVLESCTSGRILYNNKTSLDTDRDFVTIPTDKCPKLKAVGRANGCPLRDRTLTLEPKSSPKRVTGRLYAPGFPALYANRTVVVYKVRTGADLKVATLTTNSLGNFSTPASSGSYYAKAASLLVPSVGVAAADTSPTAKVG